MENGESTISWTEYADLANGWLKSYSLPYKLEQESLNSEIDKALDYYHSKSGGKGGNRPDAKLLLQDKQLRYFPILIEYKGYKDKLVKLNSDGQVDNLTSKTEPNFKNIKDFAVNGAVHYANAVLHHTSYTKIIAIGVTGYKDKKTNKVKGIDSTKKMNQLVEKYNERDEKDVLRSEIINDFSLKLCEWIDWTS